MKGLNRLHKIVASVFYIGYFPVAPGTIGSLAALFLYFFIKDNPYLMGIIIVVCLILGLATSGKAERLLNRKDPGEIVIDEFTGMLVALFLLPAGIGCVISAFLLFRFFDIVKPSPINKLEKLGGSLGVMLDDIAAGICTNLILQIVCRIF